MSPSITAMLRSLKPLITVRFSWGQPKCAVSSIGRTRAYHARGFEIIPRTALQFMRKRYKLKLRSCSLCKPHKMHWDKRWTKKDEALLKEYEAVKNSKFDVE